MSLKVNCDCVHCQDLKAVQEAAKVLAPEHRYVRLCMYSDKEVWHCRTCCEDHILRVKFDQRVDPDTKALWLANECKLKKGEKLLATALEKFARDVRNASKTLSDRMAKLREELD